MLTVLRCSAQVVKNGTVSAHAIGHGDAGAARGRQPWSSLLPTFLHLRGSWRRTIWSNRCVNSLFSHVLFAAVVAAACRGVDPYGTGGTRPSNIWTGGDMITNVPPIFLE